MSQGKMFKEFNEQYAVGKLPQTRDELLKAAELIADELKELYQELYGCVVFDVRLLAPKENVDIAAVAKEMTDIRYITGERESALGFDVDKLDAEVHRSNMSKLVLRDELELELVEAKKRYPEVQAIAHGDGFVLRCGRTNKVVKPSCYSKAKITSDMV